MHGRSILAWVTFHALDFTAIMVIAGCAIAIHRRLHDRGAIALQQFMLDFVPHLLLIAVSVTGLMLTASSLWLKGYMYSFIALSHQALVIMTLFYLPFGKLFHVVQRPASIGVELYQRSEREAPQAVCPRCGTEFVGQMWLDDLKDVVGQLGFDYSDGGRAHASGLLPALQTRHARAGLCHAPAARRAMFSMAGGKKTATRQK